MRSASYWFVIAILTAFSITGWADPANTARLSPDGSVRLTLGRNCTLVLWDTASGKRIATLYEPRHVPRIQKLQWIYCSVRSSGFSHDGKLLATQRTGEPAVLWDARNGSALASFGNSSPCGALPCMSVEFSPNSRFISTVARHSGYKKTRKYKITVWDVATHMELLNIRAGEDSEFHSASFSPDGKTLLTVEGWRSGPTSGPPDTIRLWDIEKSKELVTLKGKSASFSQDGNFLIVSDSDHPDMLWDIRAGELRVLKKRGTAVQGKSK